MQSAASYLLHNRLSSNSSPLPARGSATACAYAIRALRYRVWHVARDGHGRLSGAGSNNAAAPACHISSTAHVLPGLYIKLNILPTFSSSAFAPRASARRLSGDAGVSQGMRAGLARRQVAVRMTLKPGEICYIATASRTRDMNTPA